ncbi:hypothetical protein CIG75_08160 [Tumebacillus algifaecis]|uniref:Calcineurin-like phosphoesterase domain-containing protein n=1 Tax=Tumebacillus algifaecis TaxID=1214604 RepID=A0A223D0A4_9BACL|nr:metallophosphoesterase [Tumebacillus algifaecis]ASS74961.1 hypothetical protein CIG75_08160 [Tumebacillus algifaecis]
MTTVLLTAGVFATLVLGDVLFETLFPKINQARLRTTRLKAGQELKILHVSDLHNMRLHDRFLERVKATKPDLIAITGDLVNGQEASFDRVYRMIEKLREACRNLYFVSGNNDWEHRRYREMADELRKRGVTVLGNEHAVLTIRDMTLNIVGVDDPHTNRDRLSLAFAGMTNERQFTLLLAHDPMIIRNEQAFQADLILSGHTHGGQIRFPVVGALVAPGQGYFPKYDKGMFHLQRGTALYIDSGLGTSRIPIRFLNRSQVSVLTVKGE